MQQGRNTITNLADARSFVAAWVASHGKVRSGILAATIEGLQGAAAIMGGSPSRYSASARADLSEAIAYLTCADWSDRAVCAETF
jgi:hypothetical protein